MKEQVYNPYLPGWEHIPDGEPYVFGDRLYIYGSHDKFGGEEHCMNDYVCWSTPVDDLSQWRYEGVIYKRTDDPTYDGASYLFAPDIQLGLDGRYYMYYAFNRSSVMSVAVCDTPSGQYRYHGVVKKPDGTAIGSNPNDVKQFDPGVFIDDDQRIYLYSGFAPKIPPRLSWFEIGERKFEGAYVFELEPDMLTVKRGPELMIKGFLSGTEPDFKGHEFYEASSMRKINGKYYFVYSSVNSHELCYAVSDRPDGGFVYGGTIISIGDVFLNGRKREDALNYLDNTHGGLVQVNGQWYIFYHRHSNLLKHSRQACAEPIWFEKDGSIKQVEVSSCGLNGGPLIGMGRYPARIACNLMAKNGININRHIHDAFADEISKYPCFSQDGEDREGGEDQYISNFKDGAIAGYKYFDFEGAKKITVKIRGDVQGIITVSTKLLGLPSENNLRLGKAATQIEISPAKDWQEFSAPLNIADGVQVLYFSFAGTGTLEFIEFELE